MVSLNKTNIKNDLRPKFIRKYSVLPYDQNKIYRLLGNPTIPRHVHKVRYGILSQFKTNLHSLAIF